VNLRLDWGSAGVPFFGELLSGDFVYAAVDGTGGLGAVVLDVAGHGPSAHEVGVGLATCATPETLARPIELLSRLHDHLRGSRGAAAVALHATVDSAGAQVRWAGVGNVRLRHLGARGPLAEGKPGQLGTLLPRLELAALRIEVGETLLVFTDGLPASAPIAPELTGLGAHELATRLVHDSGRRHDDAACLVLRVVHDER
jgi:hypothetical protein